MSNDNINEIKKSLYEYISSRNELLRHIGLELWKNPEIGLEETFAHKLLTDILETEGFSVTRNFILETGFKAVFETASQPHIVYFCEYDALPNIGHACGHNLIAEAGIGAALGLKHTMEEYGIKCRLTVLGSPAEENAGGKVSLIDANALENVDVAMMVHPREINSFHMPHCAEQGVEITYEGRSAHATASPWEGKNALDAAIIAYQGVACFRKQMKPSCTINIKLESNNAVNIIPDLSTMEADLRAPSVLMLKELDNRLQQITKGAALIADCKVDYKGYEDIYKNLVSNKALLKAYKENAKDFGIEFKNIYRTGGSTDMGNVSHVVPSIHPVYFIGSEEGPHTEEFTKWTGQEKAHDLTVIQIKILAAVGIDIATNSSLVELIQNDFDESKEAGFVDIDYSDLY